MSSTVPADINALREECRRDRKYRQLLTRLFRFLFLLSCFISFLETLSQLEVKEHF